MSAQRSPTVLSRASSSSASSSSSESHNSDSTSRQRPGVTPLTTRPQTTPNPQHSHRRRRGRRNRRTHTASGHLEGELGRNSDDGANTFNSPAPRRNTGFYLQPNLSGVSMDSTALLDHREQMSMRPRRSSTATALFDSVRSPGGHPRYQERPAHDGAEDDGQSSENSDNETRPLIRIGAPNERTSLMGTRPQKSRPSTSSSRRAQHPELGRLPPPSVPFREYGSINFPPSVPSSPHLEASRMARSFQEHDFARIRNGNAPDTLINIDTHDGDDDEDSHPPRSPPKSPNNGMRSSTFRAEEDVCFPVDDGLLDEDEATEMNGDDYPNCRRRRREWPDFSVLEEWSRDEKEERSEGIRAKKLPEPVYVGGRLRPPVRAPWHRDEEELPYRFTYFNEELPATIHSHTISELLQPGQSFADLFRPEPRVLEDSSEDELDASPGRPMRAGSTTTGGDESRTDCSPPEPSQSLPRLGPRPTFWLDVFSPTDAEMKIISKAFGIHPLTSEDIMMQEAREKVELFRSYYLVSYRTFEQDSNSEDYMDPVNIYVVVFRDGVISFHFSQTPHPANVRRRIRQLKDYITVSADWISYALIDDITDAFQPLIQSLESEVDDIDDAILRMHIEPDSPEKKKQGTAASLKGDDPEEQKSDGDMLKRVGDSRRNVMSLYRLMGNKADVIKGFAKRCNEQWQVAPRSEIGLYLGDIQDHIVTMVSNLNHMEKILSRSHSNYLAQINIKMNERQEQTADVLGRLTVLGTIVLPMNIITGLWGMNVMVPGQNVENLDWFWCITAGLLVFGFMCYWIAKRVYKIM